jgi:hypothetical protein
LEHPLEAYRTILSLGYGFLSSLTISTSYFGTIFSISLHSPL